MRALLDINVLIAMLDPDHSLHERARTWFSRNAQNGCARVPTKGAESRHLVAL